MKRALTIRTWLPAILLALTLMGLAVPALAVDFPVSAEMTLTPDAISGPGTVTAQIQVTNVSGQDMQRPVSLYDPNGKLVNVFGRGGEATLKKDASTTISAQVTVTQAMLDAGQVTYTLRWQDDNGQELALPVVGEVHFSGEKGGLRITRSISPEVVRSGQTVKITYELTNTGESTISTISVQEKLVKNPKSVKALAAGDTKKVEFSAKMGDKDLVSGATVKFRATSSSPAETAVVEDVTIPLAVKNLNAELLLDKTAVDIGQTVVLTLNISNDGNISYTNVTATDKNLGTLFEGLDIPAGASLTQSKEITVNGPASYQLKLNLNDNTGMTNSYDTNSVQVSAYDPEKELLLTMLLTADKESLVRAPEDVAMTLVVTNTSNVDCKNVAITHAGVNIYTIPELKAGQSVTVKRDYTVSQAGQFRFTATTKDTVGNTAVFESNTLTLTTARVTPAPTAVPTPTVAPLVTLAPVTYENVSQPLRIMRSALYTAAFVLGGLAAAALALFLISSIVRMKKRHDSNTAYDHLDLAEKRDYSQPAEDGGEEGGAAAPAREDMTADDAADSPDEPAAEATEEKKDEEEPADSPMGQSGGFRMTRETQTDEFPVYTQPEAGREKPEYRPVRRAQQVERTVDETADIAAGAAAEAAEAAEEAVGDSWKAVRKEAEEAVTDAREAVGDSWKAVRKEAGDTLADTVEEARRTVTNADHSALPDRRRRNRNRKG